MAAPSHLSSGTSASVDSEKQEHFYRIWKSAVEHFEHCFGRKERNSSLYNDRLSPDLVFQLEPSLRHLDDFISGMAVVMPRVASETGIVWGLLDLLIESLYKNEDLFSDTVHQLDQMIHHLGRFRDYEWIFEQHSDLEETFILAFAPLVVLLVDVTAGVKQNRRAAEATISADFSKVIEQVERQTVRINQRAQARAWQSRQPDSRELDGHLDHDLDLARSKPDDNSVLAAETTISADFSKVIEQVERQTMRINQRAQARALQSRQPDSRELDGHLDHDLDLARSKSDDGCDSDDSAARSSDELKELELGP